MADDFDDLFARTSPTRTFNAASSSSVSALSPPRMSKLSSSAMFGAEDGDDEFGVSSNPFADMQSSNIYSSHMHQQPSPASLEGRMAGLDVVNSSQLDQEEQSPARNNFRRSDSSSTDATSTASHREEAEDRVAVSPFNAPGPEDGGEPTLSDDPLPFEQARDAPAGLDPHPFGLSSSSNVHNVPALPVEQESNGFADYGTTPTPALYINDLEDGNGFRDRVEEREEDRAGSQYSSRRTSVSENDSVAARRDVGDAGSIRTVGLEGSDVASMRSVQTLIHPERVTPSAPLSDDASGRPTFMVTVGDPTKVGSAIDPINSHTVYTIRTRTSSTSFRKTDFSVLRRYRDFLWLNERLLENNPGVIVPPPPEKAAIGRFSQNFVENRRFALQSCLRAILKHPLLYTDPDLKTFLESDTFHTDIKQRAAQVSISSPADAKPSFFSSLTSPRFAEFDDFFEARRGSLDAFEASLKSLILVLHNLGKSRSAVLTASGELYNAYIALGSCEVSAEVREAVNLLADTEKRRKDMVEAQIKDEEQHLLSTADHWARLIASVRTAFQSRIKAYQTWQRNEGSLRNARSTHEKAKKSGRSQPELVTSLLYEATECERKASSSKRDFEEISKLIKTELARFDQDKITSFKDAIEAYSDGLVERQLQIVQGWRDYVATLERVTGRENKAENGSSGQVQAA